MKGPRKAGTQTSVLGAAERYGYRKSVFYDCQKDREGAIENIKNALNECSADNPLYFILAPPQLDLCGSHPYRTEMALFSHSPIGAGWNDGYTTRADNLMTHNKRDVIPQGINWVQITDQNQFLSTSRYGRPAKPEEWRPWYWMRDSDDSKVRFLWERLLAVTRARSPSTCIFWRSHKSGAYRFRPCRPVRVWKPRFRRS